MRAAAQVLTEQLFTSLAAARIDFLVDQAFLIPLCQLFHCSFVFFLCLTMYYLTLVVNMPIIVSIPQLNQTINTAVAVEVRNFVLLAVSVRVLLTERFQHIVILVKRCRNLKPELVKPVLTDIEADRRLALKKRRNIIEMTVGSNAARYIFRMLVKYRLDIRRVLFYQILKRNECAFNSSAVKVRLAPLNNIRQRTVRQHDVEFLVCIRIGHRRCTAQLDICLSERFLEHCHLVIVKCTKRTPVQEDRQIQLFRSNL